MHIELTKEDLIAFEEDIGECFNKGLIKAPIHLYNGNEEEMINIFQREVKQDDWIACSWRSHYQCLLKGVPKELLKNDILDGKSITLCYPQFKIISSAIVGGIIPIALGIAMSLKLATSKNRVICFVGDMTACTGAMWEAVNYATRHSLPILFVIEDNNKSVCTDTRQTWGGNEDLPYEDLPFSEFTPNVMIYDYTSKYPHAGSGKRIQF